MNSVFVIFPFLVFTSAFSSDDGIKVKAVPPIYKTEVKNVSLYEATIPIFFYVQLPTLRNELPSGFDELCKTNKSEVKNGTNDHDPKEEFYCNLEKQFLRASNHIIKDLQQQTNYFGEEPVDGIFNESLISTPGRNRRQATVAIAATTLIAGFLLRPAVGRLTGSLFGTNDEWVDHYNTIRKSLLAEHDILLEFEQSTHTFAQEMTSILGNISEVLIAQKRDLIWSLRLLTTKMHADFIQDAVRSCKANLLPENLVREDFLKSVLTKLERNFTKVLNYSLAIDFREEMELAKYFKLPIAECRFTKDKAIIMLNLPLKEKNSLWKLFELVHTKFSYNGQVCEVYPQEASHLAQDFHANKTVLISKNMLKYCSILEQRLCMIPRFGRESTQSLRCGGGIGGQSSLEEFSKTCSFQCYTSDELIITEVDEKTLIVTNSKNITYNCSGSEAKTIKTGKVGALEVNLDCGCSIRIDEKVELPKPFVCPTSTSSKIGKFRGPPFSVTVPFLWTHNLSSLNTDIAEMDNHVNLEHHINKHWSWLIPVLNFTKAGATSTVNFTVPEEVLATSHTSPMIPIGIWLTLVTTVLLLHVIFTFYCFFKLALSRYGYGSYDVVPQPGFRHTIPNESISELQEDVCVKRRQHRHILPDKVSDNDQRTPESEPNGGNNSDVYRSNRNSVINKLI